MEYIDKMFNTINKLHIYLGEKFGEDDKNTIIRNTKIHLQKKEKEIEKIEVINEKTNEIIKINDKSEKQKEKIIIKQTITNINKLEEKQELIDIMIETSKKRETESYNKFMESLHKSKQTKIKRKIKDYQIETKLYLKEYKIHKNRKIKLYEQKIRVIRELDDLRQDYCNSMDIKNLDNQIIHLSTDFGNIDEIREKIDVISELKIDKIEFSQDLSIAFEEQEEEIENNNKSKLQESNDELEEYMDEYEEMYGVKKQKELEEENKMKKFDKALLNIIIPTDIDENKQKNNKIKNREYM